MDRVVACLRAQGDELAALLSGVDDVAWGTPTRCPGWTVADVMLHLAQTSELAAASAAGDPPAADNGWTLFGMAADGNVDEAAAAAVSAQRGAPPTAVYARWRTAAAAELGALAACDPHSRVSWVAGDLSARTLATTRLAECWIHANDVAAAVDVELESGDRLWHIARLAWRTLPYAFARAGVTLTGPVAVILDAPGGSEWSFGDASGAGTIIRGEALEFCQVAARRMDPARSSLHAQGPDAVAVLELVRTYA